MAKSNLFERLANTETISSSKINELKTKERRSVAALKLQKSKLNVRERDASSNLRKSTVKVPSSSRSQTSGNTNMMPKSNYKTNKVKSGGSVFDRLTKTETFSSSKNNRKSSAFDNENDISHQKMLEITQFRRR